MTDRLRKIFASMLLTLVLFASSAGLLLYPKTAHAILGAGDTSATILDWPRIQEWIIKTLKDIGESALVVSITTALINTMTYAADRLAYDAAVFIASGGDGEDPMFENRTIGEYFADYGASVAGEALGAMDEEKILGNFSLCQPSADVTLAFKFGLKGVFSRPKPSCDFNEVKENWGGFLTDIATTAKSPFDKNSLIVAKLADAYNPKSNDFSVGIMLYSDVLNKAQTDAALNAQRQLFGSFFKDKTDFITGRVETPAELLASDFTRKLAGPDDTRKLIGIQTLGDKDILKQIGLHAGSVFTNTLLSKFTEKLFNGLFGGIDQSDIDPFDDVSFNSDGSEDARQSFRSFLAATPLTIENYSILGEFGACPSQGKGLYNCVADSSLISAVARADGGASVTIGEAMEEGLLNSSWPLIPSADAARDQDPFCYSYGYCHGNLVKLRKARIISVGWELAAESNANSEASPITLGEVVDSFHVCNDQGGLDDNHPWCHLIDPDWVLKYPETQCKAQVYGQQLVASVTDERLQECVDMPSCIDEDGDGNCTGGYGYCVREENVWRFRGEECPDYYGSCSTYQDPDGNEVNFLSNTTNGDGCTADSAGCLWYSTQKIDDSGSFDWPDYSTETLLVAAEAGDDIYRNRMYFTAEVEDCSADDAGCRELVSRENGATLNMISNASFEDDDDADGIPDGWLISGSGTTYADDASVMLSGTDAVNPGASGIVYQPGLVLSQGAEYTLSFYAKQNASAATTGVLLALTANDGSDVDFRGFDLSGDCNIYAYTAYNLLEVVATPGSDYARYSCTFTVPTLANTAAEITAIVDLMGGDLWFDDVQLEQESAASDFHEEYSTASLDLTYVKAPPPYLGCTGGAEDPVECANYATVCSETNVGCSLYSPTNGDPAIAGIADATDACPLVCVGYDTFKQEATRYEPDGNFPVYFIPESAEECSAQFVGCDEFTDISSEEPSYFTYLRACVTSTQADANTATSDAGATFYTWEGSDTDGYQLKTWTLLESDMGALAYTYASGVGTDSAPDQAPCTSWTSGETGITCNDDSISSGVLDSDTASCDEHDDIITNPDCREFYDVDGLIHYREWTDTVTVDDACVTYRKTDIVGSDVTEQETNCEESGGYFDSTTVTCRYYGNAAESFECPVKEAGCREYTGGRSRNSRQAFAEYFEEGDLTNWEAASASTVTLSNESIATDGHSLSSNNETVWTYVGTNSTACAVDEGCETTAGNLGGICTLSNGETSCGTLSEDLFAGKTYTVSFWAKGTGTLSVGFDTAVSGTPAIDAAFANGASAMTLNTDWNEYSYGPLDMNSTDYPDFGDGASALVFTPSSGGTFYVDNVILREGEDNITILKDSWVTPAECDATPEGTSSPQYYLGCAEYSDQNGDTSYLHSFSSLCEESQVGCSAYFMTQESNDVGAAVYGALCSTIDGAQATSATSCYYALDGGGTAYDTTSLFLCTIGVGTTSCEFNIDWYVPAGDLASHLSYAASTVVSPADKDVFLVVNDDVECTSDVAGCIEVGLPVFSQDHTAVDSWTTTYLMNTPDDYATTLCSQDELFCNAWQDSSNNMHYFKDPQNQTCEYRTDVTIDNVTYSGWFKTGTDELCYDDYIVGGDVAGIWHNGDAGYERWVGECLTKYDTCSEFQDLADLAPDELYGNADGSSYFYLNNDSLEENSLPDSQKCNGEVSQKDGCGLFNDSSNPAKTYTMSASYVASKHADALFGGSANDLVEPIDCDATAGSSITTPTGDIVDLCANRCWYDADNYYDINGTTENYVYDGSCYDNSDCRPLTSESGAAVDGFCATSYSGLTAPRLENDANSILKVNRDRECSEWLSCSDAQTTWDERTNMYVTICGDIGLCTEYSTTGNASFCSAWKDGEPATVLDTEAYSGRDVSWYGSDYSGFAIPGSLPVDQLEQVNVAPISGACNTINAGDGPAAFHGEACENDGDCGFNLDTNGDGTVSEDEITYDYCPQESDSDYRLAYIAGTCSGEYGDACSVGYCENTGSACVSTDDCGVDGGSCLVGSCYDVSTTICASSADCTTGDECLSGFCATPGDDAVIDDYVSTSPNSSCDSGETMFPSINFINGTCIRDSCVLTSTGTTFATDTSEGKVCRGYPEINSPFPNSIVTQWQDPTDATEVSSEDSGFTVAENGDAAPVSFVQNFEHVQTCALGEDCECSYNKIEYNDGAAFRYFAQDTVLDVRAQGICSGGTQDGGFCTDSSDCVSIDDVTVADGTCTLPTKIDDVLGLEGYCLERDSSTNILGDRDIRACLTWLPVDQLAGSTDNYAKYTEAGYFEETNYCSYLTQYATVGTSWGCLERDDTETVTQYECFNENTACPPGFFMVGGPWKGAYSANGDVNEDADDDSTHAGLCKDGDNDCPFMCVPMNSASPSIENCQEHTENTYDSTPSNNNNPSGYVMDRYWIDSSEEYEQAFNELSECATDGVEYYEYSGATTDGTDLVETFTSTTWGWMAKSNRVTTCSGDAAQCGWYDYNGAEHFSAYFACKEYTQVASGDPTDGSAPWTDVLLNTSRAAESLISLGLVSSSYPMFGYINATSNTPFGATESEADMESGDAAPSYVAQCVEDNGNTVTYHVADGTPSTGFSCSVGAEKGDINAAQAGAYAYFDGYEYYRDTTSQEERPVAFTEIGASGGGITDILNRVFAKGMGVLTFEDGVIDADGNPIAIDADHDGDGSINASPTAPSSALWDDRALYGVGPSVWAVDVDNCVDDECEEDQGHAITLNDQNEGDIAGDSFYRAYLKFYAAADKNQLPIRRVIVDWGDDDSTTGTDDQTGSTSEDNYYKNHRGLQPDSETSICEMDEISLNYEWGMNADSCETNYFNYNHIYTCNPAGLTACIYDAEGHLTTSPCSDDGESCVFQPRVHMRDNWGWCTGVCNSASGLINADGTDGCFDNDGNFDSSPDTEDECDYQTYPSTTSPDTDPWVYYDGVITVTP